MNRIEKRVLAVLGAVGTAGGAMAGAFQGANLAEGSQEVQIAGLVCTAVSLALLGGIAYYKAAVSE